MKIERFIKEYASSKRAALENNDLIDPGIRTEMLNRIERAIAYRERGLITADEAIKIIGGFIDREEDMSQYMTA